MGNSRINNLASDIRPAVDLSGTAIADQSLTVDATVGGKAMIATALDGNTDYVFWSISGADAYVTFDNSAPTTSNGHLIKENSSSVWSAETANAAKWIRAGGTSATLHISEFQVK